MKMKEHKIPAGNYQGYIWKSDSSTPIYKDGTWDELSLKDGENPFFLEGQLFSEETKTSYSIKFLDGHYLLKEYHVSPEEMNDDNNKRVYYSNRMGDYKLVFVQRWVATDNPECLNWPVLTPKELVFVGFKK